MKTLREVLGDLREQNIPLHLVRLRVADDLWNQLCGAAHIEDTSNVYALFDGVRINRCSVLDPGTSFVEVESVRGGLMTGAFTDDGIRGE